MIKRTLLFTTPAYLSTRFEQLVVKMREAEEEIRIPMEDIGVLVLESPEVTLTAAALAKLTAYNAAVVVCNVTNSDLLSIHNNEGTKDEADEM